MIHFNVDKVFNDAAEYIYSDEKKPLADDVEYRADIAWIASHFGFLYGMLYALNHKE